MKRLLSALIMAAAVVLSMDVAVSHAAPLTPDKVTWSYNFYPKDAAVTADGFAPGDINHRITFSDQPKIDAAGSSDIVATNLKAFSTSAPGAPDKLISNGAYTVYLNLTSEQNGTMYEKTLTFTGKLSGTFSAKNSNVTNVFDKANKKQTVRLGGFDFTVEMMYYTPPGPPEQGNLGAMSAHVTVSNPGPSSTTPEPSTLVMAGLSLSFFGGVAWRKRRAEKKQQTDSVS